MKNLLTKFRCLTGSSVVYQGTARWSSSVSNPMSLPQPHKWNRAVSEAEELVGFPTSMISLRHLMNDDVSGLAEHMRRLMGSDHPMLKTLKRLTYHEKNNLQVRGLMILLMARTCRAQFQHQDDFQVDFGILTRQRKLAEYIEMIYSAQMIHKSVLNIPQDFHSMKASDLKSHLYRLEYGNKMAILGGDYLLANACTGLADLRDSYSVEVVSVAIANFSQSEFLGLKDVQGRFVPNCEHISVDSWIHRNTLMYGDLMAAGCRAALSIANVDGDITEKFTNAGFNLSLALQGFTELQPFDRDHFFNPQEHLDLGSAPILFHLQNDPELLKYIEAYKDDIGSLDMKQIYEAVKGGQGPDLTFSLIQKYANDAKKIVDAFEDEDAKHALLKMIQYLKEE